MGCNNSNLGDPIEGLITAISINYTPFTLNKAQRHRIYKKSLRYLNVLTEGREFSLGLCHILSLVTVEFYGFTPNCSDLLELFPEFDNERKRRRVSEYDSTFTKWWSSTANGYAARRKALERCIRATAPNKRKS